MKKFFFTARYFLTYYIFGILYLEEFFKSFPSILISVLFFHILLLLQKNLCVLCNTITIVSFFCHNSICLLACTVSYKKEAGRGYFFPQTRSRLRLPLSFREETPLRFTINRKSHYKPFFIYPTTQL